MMNPEAPIASATSPKTPQASPALNWSRMSWKDKVEAQHIDYADQAKLDDAVAQLESFPPLVTSWEIEKLRARLHAASLGKAFVIQGGDCAETLAECRPDKITNKLKILLQMSLVLAQGLKRPIVRVGRFAGQYAKPRSSPMETKKKEDGSEISLPSYFGDLVNDSQFEEKARQPDPYRMVRAFKHSAITLNFIRSLIDGGFADLHHPEYWDLKFLERAELPEKLRESYRRTTESLSNAIEFMEAVGEQSIERISRPEFYTSHEGLNLLYESALTRCVPRREGAYDLSCHLPWIGERTRQLDGAHVEFFRGVRNPIGVKVGPSVTPYDLMELAEKLDPAKEPGRLVIITRIGAGHASEVLTPLIRTMRTTGHHPVWFCDPMHANTMSTSSGVKTRRFQDVLQELREVVDVHETEGSILAGVHFELTGENVNECVGGASGVTEEDLDIGYESLCDPRLNYEQAMEMAFAIADRMSAAGK